MAEPDTVIRYVLEDQNRLGDSLRFLGTQQTGYYDKIDWARLASAKVFISLPLAKRRQRDENRNPAVDVRFEIRRLVCKLESPTPG